MRSCAGENKVWEYNVCRGRRKEKGKESSKSEVLRLVHPVALPAPVVVFCLVLWDPKRKAPPIVDGEDRTQLTELQQHPHTKVGSYYSYKPLPLY